MFDTLLALFVGAALYAVMGDKYGIEAGLLSWIVILLSEILLKMTQKK